MSVKMTSISKNLDLERLESIGLSRPPRLPPGLLGYGGRGKRNLQRQVVNEDEEAVIAVVLRDGDVDTIHDEDIDEVGSLGMMTVAQWPSTAVDWRALPFLLKRTR